MAESEKAVSVIHELKKAYPDAKYYLNFKTPLELMVAAILSAQVKDELVNEATKSLFKEYKTAKDYAETTTAKLLKHVSKITFARKKAENIIKACKLLAEKHNGKVPKNIDELVELPGIGRKTAIVILTNAYDQVDGVVVDTHVLRVAYRLGWTKNKNPDRVERDLNTLLPKKFWKETQWLLKAHGRAICKAPIPKCTACPVSSFCPKIGVTKKN